jgi:chitin disaccharide deacetylase
MAKIRQNSPLKNHKLARQSSPSRWVVITADDFGISSSVNRAIVQAHQQGVLTSTSLMVTGDAFAEAVELAQANPKLAVGLHLVLTCGRSVLPPNQIPHLVDAQGQFSNSAAWAGLRYQFNRPARQEVRQEIHAQLEKFRQTGLPLSHVDGHLHLHVHPWVIRCLAEFAPEFGIRYVRLPYEELRLTLAIDRANLLKKILWAVVFSRLHHADKRILQDHGIDCPDRVYGLLQTGEITENYLLQLIPQIQANRVELYTHPDYHPETGASPEFQAISSIRVRDALTQQGFQLTNYFQL